MKPLPKKIYPNHLRSTVVEFRFVPRYEASVQKGMLWQVLSGSLDPVSEHIYRADAQIHLERPRQIVSIGAENPLVFLIGTGKFSLTIHERHLFFNMVDAYPGWSDYKRAMQMVFDLFEKIEFMGSIQRIGLRYVSVHPNMTLGNATRLKLSLPQEINKSSIAQIRFQEVQGSDEIISTFQDLLERKQSIIDIDVSTNLTLPKINWETAEPIADRLHNLQKRRFFDILHPDYLEELNPKFR